ncbi:hypothetical protein ACFL5Q_05055, partial [Planctomycetota bacterium]
AHFSLTGLYPSRKKQHDKGKQTRLQLYALAYNPANFLRRLAVPKSISQWTLTTLRECVVGGRPPGTAARVRSTAERLGLEFTLRGPGPPRKTQPDQ